MLRPFHLYDWIVLGDIERCPFSFKTEYDQWKNWERMNDVRILCIGLDRYAHYLTTERQQRAEFFRNWKRHLIPNYGMGRA